MMCFCFVRLLCVCRCFDFCSVLGWCVAAFLRQERARKTWRCPRCAEEKKKQTVATEKKEASGAKKDEGAEKKEETAEKKSEDAKTDVPKPEAQDKKDEQKTEQKPD